MNFLPDSYTECEECRGMRYQNHVLDIKWRGKNIAEILDLSFEEACTFFSFDEILKETFLLMNETGLGYIRLGQTSPTLSGGRLKGLSSHQNWLLVLNSKQNRPEREKILLCLRGAYHWSASKRLRKINSYAPSLS